MYTIEVEDFFGKEKIKLCNQLTGEYLSVIPAFGGNINELVLLKNGQLHSIIAGDSTLVTLSGKNSNFYRGAKLSPFPNRINKGEYTFEGKEYQLETNAPPHALHGLCWNAPFIKEENIISADSARLVLLHRFQSAHKGYPFSYTIEIEYLLKEHSLTCYTAVLNTSEHNIPIGDGWHPYFTTGSKVNALKLQLPNSRQLELKELIPTGNYSPGQPFAMPTSLNDTLLDHCFELDKTKGIAETKLIDEDKDLCITIWQQTGPRGYNFIQTYTPPDRNSIAIEPMSCAPDAFNNKNGLITLSPREFVELSFGIKLE